MQPTIAITGANGFIGQRLTRHFSDQGWHVKALVRNPNKGQDGELNKLPGVTFAQYDLFNSFDTQLLNNCNAIIHAAYVTHTQHKTANQINQSALKQLVEAAQQSNTHVVYISSFSAHEKATSDYGKSKLACEQLLDPNQHCIIKPGLVIGKSGLAGKIIQQINKRSLFPLIGGGLQPIQPIAVDDLCQILFNCVCKQTTGKYWVASPEVINLKTLYLAIAEANHKSIKFINLPEWPIALSFQLAEALHIPLPFSSENLRGLQQLRSFETQPSLTQLNYTLETLSTTLKKLTSEDLPTI